MSDYVSYNFFYYGQLRPLGDPNGEYRIPDNGCYQHFYNSEEALKDVLRGLAQEAKLQGGYLTFAYKQGAIPAANETIVVVRGIKTSVLVPTFAGGTWDFDMKDEEGVSVFHQ